MAITVEIPCPTCITCPVSLRTSKKSVSFYLPWDKDFIALAKKIIQIMRYVFFLFLEENICCGYPLLGEIRNKKNVNFQASKSWFDKWILTIYLLVGK